MEVFLGFKTVVPNKESKSPGEPFQHTSARSSSGPGGQTHISFLGNCDVHSN